MNVKPYARVLSFESAPGNQGYMYIYIYIYM